MCVKERLPSGGDGYARKREEEEGEFRQERISFIGSLASCSTAAINK